MTPQESNNIPRQRNARNVPLGTSFNADVSKQLAITTSLLLGILSGCGPTQVVSTPPSIAAQATTPAMLPEGEIKQEKKLEKEPEVPRYHFPVVGVEGNEGKKLEYHVNPETISIFGAAHVDNAPTANMRIRIDITENLAIGEPIKIVLPEFTVFNSKGKGIEVTPTDARFKEMIEVTSLRDGRSTMTDVLLFNKKVEHEIHIALPFTMVKTMGPDIEVVIPVLLVKANTVNMIHNPQVNIFHGIDEIQSAQEAIDASLLDIVGASEDASSSR